jgi:O-antigen ligase
VAEISIPDARAGAPRPIAQAPLLVLPALSCLLAVVVYVWLSGALASVILGALVLAGVAGLIRRVPFAGAFTLGLVVAGLLVRFS